MFGNKEQKELKKQQKAEKALEEEQNAQFIPDKDEIRRALNGVLTQDPDITKLFKKGRKTYVKLLGGDLNNFINLNANLVSASLLLQILETLERIESKLDDRYANKPSSDK